MSTGGRLPPELIGCIIGNLAYDPASLQACALASRSFLFPAQRHLFRQLSVKVYQLQWDAVNERLHDIRVRPQRYLTSVRSLYISSLSHSYAFFDASLLVHVVELLVNVTQVRIHCKYPWEPFASNGDSDVNNVDILRACCQSTITQLGLDGCHMFPSDDFHRCTSLTHLSLSNCAFLPPERPRPPKSSQITIRSLYLGAFKRPTTGIGGVIAAQFLQDPSCPWDISHLHSFHFVAPEYDMYEEFMAFMKCLPQFLVSFTAKLPYEFNDGTIIPRIDISMLPQLKTLKLQVKEHDPEKNGHLPWITSQLRDIPINNQLSELHLIVTMDRGGTIQGPNWAELDDTLANDQFKKLGSVHIGLRLCYCVAYNDRHDLKEFVPAFRNFLPKTGTHKVLRVKMKRVECDRDP